METTGLLFATAAAEDGGPAAALRVAGSTLVGRLLSQLESLGIHRVWLVTRPAWKTEAERAARSTTADVTVVGTGDLSGDFQAAADIVSGIDGAIVVASAHTVVHRETLAVLCEPRTKSGALATTPGVRAPWSFAVRSARGRIVSAASPYHRVESPNGSFLGVIRVDQRDREQLIAVARELAEFTAAPRPRDWDDELARKADEWRTEIGRDVGEADAEVAVRLRAAGEDPVPLLLVGLVRTGVVLSSRSLGRMIHATPLSAASAARVTIEFSGLDDDRVALDSAVKATDGFFTTFFVSPYSKYLARFAARRGWSPNAMTVLSLAIGVVAAAAFAVGTRPGLVAGAVLLQLAFTVDCVDGQLARYTHTFSNLGAWLDSVLDRAKEYVVYGGLAVGAARGFDDDVWTLAAAALTLQTVRHIVDFSYTAGDYKSREEAPPLPIDQPDDVPLPRDASARPNGPRGAAFDGGGTDGGIAVATRARPRVLFGHGRVRAVAGLRGRKPRVVLSTLGRYAASANQGLEREAWTRWGKRILALPIGERFALISITAAIATPRVTFLALLAWGGAAAAYTIFTRMLIRQRT